MSQNFKNRTNEQNLSQLRQHIIDDDEKFNDRLDYIEQETQALQQSILGPESVHHST